MSEGEGASNKVFGSGDNRWRGQIVDDSVWRDNILAGKYEDKDTPEGWGRRYKVRIFGEHDLGGADGFPIRDDQLPWAMIEFPVTAGSGAGNCRQTPALRQGNIVSGYWADGHNKQMPVITGVIGNNEQNIMGTEYPVPVTESGTSLAVSAFPNKQLKLPDLVARPKPPQTSLITKKPTPKGATEPSSFDPNARLDNLGLPLSMERSAAVLADIARATEVVDARIASGQNLNSEQVLELTKFYVQRGLKQRDKQARSPFSGASPGATTEALGEHLKTASDIGREDKFQEKIILISPDNVVDSATKAIQTISDNLTHQIKLYTNSLTDYAAATQRPSDDFGKMIKDSSGQISKYMKVIMQKVQEYTNKTMNAELSDVVAEMPSYMRAQFLDVKEENNKELLKKFNSITDEMGGLIENILETTLDVKKLVSDVQKKAASSSPSSVGAGILAGIANEVASSSVGSNDFTTDLSGVPQLYDAAFDYSPGATILFEGITYINKSSSTNIAPPNDTHWQRFSGQSGGNTGEDPEYQNEEQNTYTKVPICYAEDIVGQVFSYNKESINGAVQKAVNGMNKYVDDMQSQLDSYEETFKYKAAQGEQKGVISLSDEEGLGYDRGGSGYTTQRRVGTAFTGSLSGGSATGGGLEVDITVSRGGPTGKTYPGFTDAQFDNLPIGGGLTWGTASMTEDGDWITFMNGGSGWSKTIGFTNYTTEKIMGCPCTGGSGQGATADVHFTNGVVDAIRINNTNYWDGTNSYAIGDEIIINSPAGANGGGAKFKINSKMVEGFGGRLRGPIDDLGIKIANGGHNYEVGQLIYVNQGPNPFPESGNPEDAIGAPSGGVAGGGVNATASVVGVLDKGTKRAGVADDPAAAGGGQGGFSDMLKNISGIMGNLTSALSFDNMPANIFPFELPPNKALADYYTLGDAGAAAPDSEIPMMGSIAQMASEATSAIPKQGIPFALPTNPQDIDLKSLISKEDAQMAMENTISRYRDASNRLMGT
jgi:hypothetical protein